MKIENPFELDEISNYDLKQDKFPILIGIGFFISIPIILYLAKLADDHGLFLLRTEFIDSIIPESFIHISYKDELRCFEESVFGWIIIYFIFLGVLNSVYWKNNSKKKLRIFHAILTIVFALIFFYTMIEEDIMHTLKMRDPIGRQQYKDKLSVFYSLFLFWIVLQLSYILSFLHDKLIKK